MVQLDPTTSGFIEVGINGDTKLVVVRYIEFQNRVPIPLRRVAAALRNLAGNLEADAAELEALEPH